MGLKPCCKAVYAIFLNQNFMNIDRAVFDFEQQNMD